MMRSHRSSRSANIYMVNEEEDDAANKSAIGRAFFIIRMLLDARDSRAKDNSRRFDSPKR